MVAKKKKRALPAVGFRFDADSKDLLDALCTKMALGQIDVMRVALRLLGKREGVTVEHAVKAGDKAREGS